MLLGFSSYCFKRPLADGTMSIDDVFDWVAASGADHVEIASFTFSPDETDGEWSLVDDHDLIDALLAARDRTGVELSGLCIAADFIADSTEQLRSRIDVVKRHVELADRMGVRYLRHDVTEWARRDRDTAEFEEIFPILVEASQEVARFAQGYQITTSVENHGFFMNASERVRRLVLAVDEPNFRTTLDIGNFLCVDEDPLIATRANLPYAGFVHVKDFYRRPPSFPFTEGWLATRGGDYLQGSIVGYGDLDIPAIVGAILDSGYDGYLSIEFEGIEDPLLACSTGLANLRRLLEAGLRPELRPG